jgi:hypothetical protein
VSIHPPPPPGAEQRQYERKDVFAQVELRVPDVGVMIVAVLNLSLGGAFFELEEDGVLHPGDGITVHLTAGEQEATQAARVVRTVPGKGFAVMWQDRLPETLAVLSILMS